VREQLLLIGVVAIHLVVVCLGRGFASHLSEDLKERRAFILNRMRKLNWRGTSKFIPYPRGELFKHIEL